MIFFTHVLMSLYGTRVQGTVASHCSGVEIGKGNHTAKSMLLQIRSLNLAVWLQLARYYSANQLGY